MVSLFTRRARQSRTTVHLSSCLIAWPVKIMYQSGRTNLSCYVHVNKYQTLAGRGSLLDSVKYNKEGCCALMG